jgi:glycerophosphoryl diester phosphodiesterase
MRTKKGGGKMGLRIREVRQNFLSFLLLVLVGDGLVEYLIGPAIVKGLRAIMYFGKIPYISYTNISEVLFQNILVSGAFLLLLVIFILAICFQITFLLLGIHAIQSKKFHIGRVLKESVQTVFKMKKTNIPFFILYFLLITPFSAAFFHTPLLNKIKIPEFITNDLIHNLPIQLGIFAVFIAFSILIIRLLFVLPNILLDGLAVRAAIRKSVQATRGKFFHYLLRYLLIMAGSAVIVWLFDAGVIEGQRLIDAHLADYAFVLGTINLTAIQVVNEVIYIFSNLLLVSVMLAGRTPDFKQPTTKQAMRQGLKGTLVCLLGGGMIAFLILANDSFFTGSTGNDLLMIAHRGVNEGVGVQNTMGAMANTIKSKPDYIEMDIRETKDHQFVVMHDENLQHLAGVDRRVGELTLAELTRLTVSENGNQDKIPSFDAYLAYANAHRQKLLIELKTAKTDSADYTARFLAKYQTMVETYHHRIHSLDYQTLTQLKKAAPNLYASFILPYDFVIPNTRMNAYTMEDSTLDASFINTALREKKDVYAWTVDDPDDMDKMIFLNVQGVITNRLTTLKEEVARYHYSKNYADKLALYLASNPH